MQHHDAAQRMGSGGKHSGGAAPGDAVNDRLSGRDIDQIQVPIEDGRLKQGTPVRGMGRLPNAGTTREKPGFALIQDGG